MIRMVYIDYNRPENLENLVSPELNRRLDKWIDQHLEGTDFGSNFRLELGPQMGPLRQDTF